MIIVKLMGGLGNQMFQYAAGRYLANLHQTELLFDLSYLLKDPKGAYTKRHLELSIFTINLNIASDSDIKVFKIDQSNKYTRTIQRNFPFLFSNIYAAESGFGYQRAFSGFPKNTYLEGFWQSERYFKSIESILKNDFQLKEPLNEENKKWMNQIVSCESVSLHIRRGDYVSNTNSQHSHNNCNNEYYIKALNKIKQKHNNSKVFVFSDDLKWCKENLKLDNTTYFVDANQANNFHLDMYLMSQCKHNIIANSSFSWWAAWLNSNKDKMIVAPVNWFSDKLLNTKDLIPSSWIKI